MVRAVRVICGRSDNDEASSSQQPISPEVQEIKRKFVKEADIIRLSYWNDEIIDPIIGKGLCGQLKNKKDLQKKDLYILKYWGKEEHPYQISVFQDDKDLVEHFPKWIYPVDAFPHTSCLSSIRRKINSNHKKFEREFGLSWFIDEMDNLMFNLHINKDCIYENIEEFEKSETINKTDVDYYNTLISAVQPEHKVQIEQHEWVANNTQYHQDHCIRTYQKKTPKENSKNFVNLYKSLRNARDTPPRYKLRLDSLACTLHEYQKDAIDFLIHREVKPAVDVGLVHEWIELSAGVFYLPSLGGFVQDASNPVVDVFGGILADEMGLGKTVEVLGLILSHQSDEDTKHLLETSKNRNTRTSDRVMFNNQQDSFIVKDLLGELVSKVSAFCDGKTGLETIMKSNKLSSTAKLDNAIYRVRNSNLTTQCIQCTGCGETWPKKKVHWLPELCDQNISFKCPSCAAEGPKVPVSATLIVVPKAICHQWYEEIKKHVKEDIKIDMYMGVAVDGYKNPHYFNQFHVVLTTYDVLAKEFQHLHNNSDNYSMRIRKRTSQDTIRKVTSPLPCIDWWRVCLDEWQLIKGGRQGEVCWQLQSRTKWCITGTPLVKNFHDFHKMLRFLQIRPYDDYAVWEHTLYNRFAKNKNLVPMIELLSQIFWRNSKNDVKNQLRIPPKQEVVTNVLLSPIETEYYNLKLTETRDKITDLLQSKNIPDQTQMSQIPSVLLRNLMDSLNSIRWALVTGEGYLKEDPNSSTKKLTGLTPSDVFEKVIKTNRNVLAETTRDVVAFLNVVAAHNMRSGNHGEAMDNYLEVMSVISEYENRIKAADFLDWALSSPVDTKQRIHALTNLLEVVVHVPNRISSDGVVAYQSQLNDLEKSYNDIDSSLTLIENTYRNLSSSNELYKEINKDLEDDLKCWKTFTERMSIKRIDNFIRKDLLEFAKMRPNIMKTKTRDAIITEIEETIRERQQQLQKFLADFSPWTEFLKIDAESELFNQVLDCPHNKILERDGERTLKVELCRTNNCPMCMINRSILDVEEKLWIAKVEKQRGTAKTARSLETRKEISLSEDPFYIALKAIQEHSCKEDKKNSSAMMANLEGWICNVRNCMAAANNIVNATQLFVTKRRELRAAKTRTSYDDDGSKYISLTKVTSLQYGIILANHLKQNERRRKEAHSKMSYAKTLMAKNDDQILECPVCYTELDTVWKMLPCLHNMCTPCYRHFTKQAYMRLECVVCRAPFSLSDVGQVKPNNALPETSLQSSNASNKAMDEYSIKGIKLTFKMAAVMRNIVSVLEEDSNNKIIVFSAMNSALEMLAHVLQSIDIHHTLFSSRTCDLENLALFKQDYNVKVLLLPLSFGANGLNLVEANHIFFMEPIPNASVFQQAQGRIFRMGQNRATTIHHLITKDTIEETIHNVVTGGNETGLTFGSFKKILGIN